MLQPKSKLPWKYEYVKATSEYGEDYARIKAAEWQPCDIMNNQPYYPDPVEDEDMKYIVQACNNFPKAVELLNESKSFKRIADYEKWIKKVEEFLKSLEKDG